MQGVVIDEGSKYVKAAIVKVFRMQDLSDESDTEAKAITYTWTDENGRFVIRDLDPDENYTIEIHVESTVENHMEEPAEIEVEDVTEINKVENAVENEVEEPIEIEIEEPAEIEVEEPVEIEVEDTVFETFDAVETDRTDETFAFIQTDEAVAFIQSDELTGSYFTCGLKLETELQDKLYMIRNCTWN